MSLSRSGRRAAHLFAALVAAGPLLAPAAAGADGVLEINQACAATGCFAGDPGGLPVLITEPGSYRLTGGLTLPSASDVGIQILADDVTLDLAGFAIEGPVACSGLPTSLSCSPGGSPAGAGIIVSGANTTVRNGVLRGVGGRGVAGSGSPTVAHVRLERLRISHVDGDGIDFSASPYVTVEDCEVSTSAGAGIHLTGGSTVLRSRVVGVRGDGIHTVDASGRGAIVRESHSVGNGGDGILLLGGGSAIGNTSSSNAGVGLSGGSGSGFNLDFGLAHTGLPDSYGAASGQVGRWVDAGPGTTSGLVNTAGAPTGVGLTLTGVQVQAGPQTTTDSILLRDSVNSEGALAIAFSASLTGLDDGDYDVYYYDRNPTTGMSVNGVPMSDLAGGSSEALEAQGMNWDVAAGVAVTGGTLVIADATPATDGLSGIQIVPSGAGFGYAGNVIRGNAGGTVVGGAEFGTNLCDGVTTCP